MESSSIETTTLKDSSSSKPVPAFRPDDDLPTNVQAPEQLALLPPECLSDNKERPLRHVDDQGNVYTYALKPMSYSVLFILSVELLERFSFYGTTETHKHYRDALFMYSASHLHCVDTCRNLLHPHNAGHGRLQ